jgi:hypothetical protein
MGENSEMTDKPDYLAALRALETLQAEMAKMVIPTPNGRVLTAGDYLKQLFATAAHLIQNHAETEAYKTGDSDLARAWRALPLPEARALIEGKSLISTDWARTIQEQMRPDFLALVLKNGGICGSPTADQTRRSALGCQGPPLPTEAELADPYGPKCDIDPDGCTAPAVLGCPYCWSFACATHGPKVDRLCPVCDHVMEPAES